MIYHDTSLFRTQMGPHIMYPHQRTPYEKSLRKLCLHHLSIYGLFSSPRICRDTPAKYHQHTLRGYTTCPLSLTLALCGAKVPIPTWWSKTLGTEQRSIWLPMMRMWRLFGRLRGLMAVWVFQWYYNCFIALTFEMLMLQENQFLKYSIVGGEMRNRLYEHMHPNIRCVLHIFSCYLF